MCGLGTGCAAGVTVLRPHSWVVWESCLEEEDLKVAGECYLEKEVRVCPVDEAEAVGIQWPHQGAHSQGQEWLANYPDLA